MVYGKRMSRQFNRLQVSGGWLECCWLIQAILWVDLLGSLDSWRRQAILFSLREYIGKYKTCNPALIIKLGNLAQRNKTQLFWRLNVQRLGAEQTAHVALVTDASSVVLICHYVNERILNLRVLNLGFIIRWKLITFKHQAF